MNAGSLLRAGANSAGPIMNDRLSLASVESESLRR